jgi:hypothetical protein
MIVFLFVVRENYLTLKIYTVEELLEFLRHFPYLANMHCCEVSIIWIGKISFLLLSICCKFKYWIEWIFFHFAVITCIGQSSARREPS